MRLSVALVLFFLVPTTHAFVGHHHYGVAARTRSGPYRHPFYTTLSVASDQEVPNVSPSGSSNEALQAAAAAAELENKNKVAAQEKEAARIAAEQQEVAQKAAEEAARIAAEEKKAAEEEAARKAAEEAARILAAEQEEAARKIAAEQQEEAARRLAAEIAAQKEKEEAAAAAILAQKKEIEGKQRALLSARLNRDHIMFEKRFAYAQKLRARQAAVEEARSGTSESIAKYRALVDAQENVSDKCFTVLCALGMHDTDDDVPDPDDDDYELVHGHLDDKHISIESDFFWEVHAERYVQY